MTFDDFTTLIARFSDPVILIEGRRSIPEISAREASRLSSLLATRFPHLHFRSGNASGADEAFAAGVIAIAPERLQIIAPDAGHRKKQRHAWVSYHFPESLDPDALETIKRMTIAATPTNHGLMKCFQRGGRTGAQAACLIRDTMKVAGLSGQLAPPVAALFWIEPDHPEAGGTGHTIRACRNAGIPVVFQDHWTLWLHDLESQS